MTAYRSLNINALKICLHYGHKRSNSTLQALVNRILIQLCEVCSMSCLTDVLSTSAILQFFMTVLSCSLTMFFIIINGKNVCANDTSIPVSFFLVEGIVIKFLPKRQSNTSFPLRSVITTIDE